MPPGIIVQHVGIADDYDVKCLVRFFSGKTGSDDFVKFVGLEVAENICRVDIVSYQFGVHDRRVETGGYQRHKPDFVFLCQIGFDDGG